MTIDNNKNFGIVPPTPPIETAKNISSEFAVAFFTPSSEFKPHDPDIVIETKTAALDLACMYENLSLLPEEYKSEGQAALHSKTADVLKFILSDRTAVETFSDAQEIITQCQNSGIKLTDIKSTITAIPKEKRII